jgi:hypothetical protein
MSRIRSHLTFANVVSLIALFVALGGTAVASVVITQNNQVAQGTISGHHPPSGDHPNIIGGSVSSKDLAKGTLSRQFHSAKLPSGGFPDCSAVIDRWASEDLFGDVGYYRDADGRVFLQGAAIKCGTPSTGNSILTLPAGFRPADADESFIVDNNGSPAALTVNHNGIVSSTGTSTGTYWVLDGVSFRCGPSGHNGCP